MCLGVVGLGERWIRPAPAVAHGLWLVVLVRFLLPPLLPGPAVVQAAEASVGHIWRTSRSSPAPRQEAAAPSTWLEAGPVRNERFEATLSWIVVSLGSMVVAGGLVSRRSRLRRLLEGSREAPRGLSEMVAELAAQLRVRPPTCRVSSHVAIPLVFGLTRGTLVWPEAFLGRPRRLQQAVIAHELAHLRRRDLWTDLLVAGTACFWWWNPVFWSVQRKLREAAERACDRWALDLTSADRSAYGRMLLELSAESRSAGTGLVARGARHALERRLRSLFDRSHGAPASLVASAGTALVLLVTLGGAGRPLDRLPQAVSPRSQEILGVYSRGSLAWDESRTSVRAGNPESWLYLFSRAQDGATLVYWSGWRSGLPEERFRSSGTGTSLDHDARAWLGQVADQVSLPRLLREQGEADPQGLHAWSYAVVPDASHANRELGPEWAAVWWRPQGAAPGEVGGEPAAREGRFALGIWQDGPTDAARLLLVDGSKRLALVDGEVVDALGVGFPVFLEEILGGAES